MRMSTACTFMSTSVRAQRTTEGRALRCPCEMGRSDEKAGMEKEGGGGSKSGKMALKTVQDNLKKSQATV